jgi:hypothetical protein
MMLLPFNALIIILKARAGFLVNGYNKHKAEL